MKKILIKSGAFILITIFLLPLNAFPAAKIKKEFVEIVTRPGVKQRFVLLAPEKPVANLIIICGGRGKIVVSKTFGKPHIKYTKNFVIESRKKFAKQGFQAAVIDVPSDKKKEGMLGYWRVSPEHAKDIEAVANYLKSRNDLPVWLLGTSLSSFSVANCGINIPIVDGLVFTSSVTKSASKWKVSKTHPNGMLDMALDKITVPVLIVAHKQDACEYTPPEGSEKIKKAIINSSKIKVIYYEGGKRPKDKACWPYSYHGFYGIQDDVINGISAFIISNLN